MRLAAFKRVEMLSKMHGHLTHRELSTGFIFQDERIPLVNPQRGIFKPRQMRYLLSIKTVIPKPGGRVCGRALRDGRSRPDLTSQLGRIPDWG